MRSESEIEVNLPGFISFRILLADPNDGRHWLDHLLSLVCEEEGDERNT